MSSSYSNHTNHSSFQFLPDVSKSPTQHFSVDAFRSFSSTLLTPAPPSILDHFGRARSPWGTKFLSASLTVPICHHLAHWLRPFLRPAFRALYGLITKHPDNPRLATTVSVGGQGLIGGPFRESIRSNPWYVGHVAR